MKFIKTTLLILTIASLIFLTGSFALGEINVQPDPGSVAGEETVAYLPFNADSYKTGNIPNDPIGWWKMDNETTVVDFGSGGNDGTVTDGTLAIGMDGFQNYSLSFDGADTMIDLGTEIVGDGDVSVSAWIFANSFGEVVASDKIGKILDNDEFKLFISDSFSTGTNYVGISSNDSITILFSNDNIIQLNTWYHIAVTRDTTGANTNIYIDGILNTNGDSGTPVVGDTNSIIGNNSTQSNTFDGSIDEVRIYNRILSPTEISELFKNQLADVTMNNNHGQLQAGAGGYGPNKNGNPNEAFKFDGVATVINLGASSDILSGNPSSMTISAWAKIDIVQSSSFVDNRLITIGRDSGTYFALGVDGTGKIAGFTLNGSTAVEILGGDITTGVWQHYILVRDNWVHTFYLDGVVSGNTFDITSTVDIGTGDATVGNLNDGTRWWDGSISDVKIFNYALSDDQVEDEFDKYRPGIKISQDYISYWPLNQNNEIGTNVVADVTGRGNNGTITPGASDGYVSNKDGQPGEAYDFAGDTFIDVSSFPENILDGGGTIVFRFKADVFGDDILLGTGDGASINNLNEGWAIGLRDVDSRLAFSNRRDAIARWSVQQELSTGTWYHGVITYDTSNPVIAPVIYINGVALIITVHAISAGNSVVGTAGLNIGASTAPAGYFDGSISDVKIWPRVLTAPQVLKEFESYRPLIKL